MEKKHILDILMTTHITMKGTTRILNIAYCLAVILFLLDCLTGFNIKSQGIKSSVYFGLIIGTPLTIIWNLVVIKTKAKRIIWITIPTIILTLILIIGPWKVLFSTGAWHTQTILYQNGHLSFRTVEYQMKDVGAFGYNERTVEVLYLTPLFMITSEVPQNINKRVEWIKVDKVVNELELKYP